MLLLLRALTLLPQATRRTSLAQRSTKKYAARSRHESPRMLLLLRALTLLRQINNFPLHIPRCNKNTPASSVAGEMLSGRTCFWLSGSRYGYCVAYPQSQRRKGFLASANAALAVPAWLRFPCLVAIRMPGVLRRRILVLKKIRLPSLGPGPLGSG